METKVCTKCNINQYIENFRMKKDCKSGKYYRNSYCKKCEKIVKKNHYEKHKEQIKIKNKKWYEKNKEKIKNIYRKKYNSEYYAQWREKHPEKVKEYIKNDLKRIKQDPLKMIKRQSRDAIRNGFRRKGFSKNTKTEKLLKCNYDTFINHLLQTFEDNYGYKWDFKEPVHIDHIVPLETATTEEDIIKLSYYKNLQLLKAKDNLQKGSKLNYKIVNNSKEIL